MYNLSLHIEYLLLGNDCVVIPGVGAFIVVHHSACFDAKEKFWTPPSREIRFNKALIHDDGLLTNSYSRKHRVSFSEGRILLNRDIESLLSALEMDNEVTLPNLGVLRKNSDTIIFEQLYSPSFYANSIGFYNAPIHIRREEINAYNYESDINNNNKEIGSVKSERNFNTSKNYYLAINKTFARIAACIIIILAISVGIFIPTTEFCQTDQASVIPLSTLQNSQNIQAIEVPDTVKTKLNRKENVNSKISESNVENHDILSEPLSSKRYHAIIGSFRSLEDAQSFMANHAVNGYRLQIISTPTMHRVSITEGDDYKELQEKIIRENLAKDFPQLWIWENYNKK